jgi:hypothetical protein
MRGDPILGQLDRDLACAIALAIVEKPQVHANVNVITLHDAQMRPLGSVSNWLGDDPLDQLTRTYLEGRHQATQAGMRKLGQAGWAGSAAIKAREEGNRRANEARKKGNELLKERGVLDAARNQGLRVIELE